MSISFIVLTVTIVLCMGFIVGTILIMGEWGENDNSSTFAICMMGLIYTFADALMLYAP